MPGSVYCGCAGLRQTEMLRPGTPEVSAQAHAHAHCSCEGATWPGAPRCLMPQACLVCGALCGLGQEKHTDGLFERTAGILSG